MHDVRVMFVAAAVCVTLDGGLALAQPTGVSGYELIEIKPLPGHSLTWVEALDQFGRLLAHSSITPSTPIVWNNGEVLFIPTPVGYREVLVNDIGSGGVVSGTAKPLDSSDRKPFVWTMTHGIVPVTLLNGTVSGVARSLSDHGWAGTLLGGSCSSGVDYATTWRGAIPTQVGGARSGANAINNLGHAVGSGRNQVGVSRPTLWRDGQIIDIGGEPYDQDGTATGVNDWTEVVGWVTFVGSFHWHDGVRTLLPALGQCGASPRAINNAGIIAGESNPDPRCINGQQHAVVWERAGPQFVLFDLNDWIPRHADLRLVSAKDINDAGQMAVFGEYTDGRERGFLVTPYLFEMSDPVPGRAGTVNTITVTGLQPNQRVHLIWGTQEGAQKVRAACPGGTLLIRDPQALPAVRADQSGVATITVNVPLIARGRTVRLQAVAPIECQISHSVTWTFE
ncbi:MAG: hypothetical protein KJZ69_06915 [Phycisphaerales bacterium]|nr:hypothetical protein [Phycisphaerales bacterium]